MITATPALMEKHGEAIRRHNDHILPQWILQHMDIEITHLDEQTATFRLDHNSDLFRRFPPPREETHLSGQAIMALADSLLVFPIVVANGSEKNMATLDLSTQFLKPIHPGDVRIEARVIQNGRRAIRGVVDVYDADDRHCATSMICYVVV